MLTPRQVLRRLRDIVRGRRLDADVDDELRFHIDMQTASLVAQGMSPGRARAKAVSDFGAVARVTDNVRQARGLTPAAFVDDVLRDIRFAARSLARTPAFSLVAVATLALGIGATTAMFSVVNGVLLRSLPYPHAERLVSVFERAVSEGIRIRAQSPRQTSTIGAHRQRPSISWRRFAAASRQCSDSPSRCAQTCTRCRTITSGYSAARRSAAARSQATRASSAASQSRWSETSSGASDSAGVRTCLQVRLQIWGSTYRIIGVMPEGFGYPDDAELWIPLEPQNAAMGRDSHNDETVARLAPGVSMVQAEAELQGIAERLKKVYPTHNGAVGAHVASLRDTLVGPVKSYLRLLLLAVIAVLLVACVNLASANLARGAGRSRELAIRTVLGAGRGRLARQLLTENLLIALLGGAIGVVLAHWLVRVLLALNPHPMPRASTIGIDSGVLVFAMLLTLLTGVLIGLLPALQVGARRPPRRYDRRRARNRRGSQQRAPSPCCDRGGVRRAVARRRRDSSCEASALC
jgi:predicted permease